MKNLLRSAGALNFDLPRWSLFMRFLPILAIWLFSLAHSWAGLEVRNPRWGFGGKVVPGTFNILSLEVKNTGGKSFEGALVLRQQGGGAAEMAQAIFLAPGTSRWVQFSPYIAGYKPDFVVSWGESWDERFALEDSRLDATSPAPVAVILADPELVRGGSLPVFSEAQFPMTVSATDTLHSIVLDHAPRLQAPQREALVDWVRAGGILHLVRGPAGGFPEFADELAVLNTTLDRARVGAGWIIKQPWPLAEVNAKLLESAGFPVPVDRGSSNTSGRYNSYEYDSYSDGSFFQLLAGLTKPKIAWWLIYLLTAVYVIVIGPVFFLLRKRDYRFLLGAFLGTVVLFSWLFTAIGRRGYGENQICHSLAIARSLGNGRYDVVHWTHAFATSGDRYRFSYPGSFQLYSAIGNDNDRVNGTVVVGKDACLEADIPLFSFRSFMHRGVMAGEDFKATVTYGAEEGKSGDGKGWKIAVATLPKQLQGAVLQVGDRYYHLEPKGNELQVVGTGGESSQAFQKWSDHYRTYRTNDEAEMAMGMQAELLSYRVGADPQKVPRFFGRPAGNETARLYLYASAPKEFQPSGEQFTTGTSYVLYVQDFALPAGSGPVPNSR